MVSLSEAKRQTEEFNRQVKVADADFRDFEITLNRTMRLLREVSGSPEINQAIRNVQRMMMTLRALELAYRAVQLARMSAGDPLAWAGAIVSVANVAVDVGANLYTASRGNV